VDRQEGTTMLRTLLAVTAVAALLCTGGDAGAQQDDRPAWIVEPERLWEQVGAECGGHLPVVADDGGQAERRRRPAGGQAVTRAVVERRLSDLERQAEVVTGHTDADQAPDWLRAALAAASVEGLMRLERMLADWPRDVVIPPAVVFVALDLPTERWS
jgi:hypothetical protein